MKLILLFLTMIAITGSARAQLHAEFTWCPEYDTSAQMCCIRFENLSTDTPGIIISYIFDFGDGDMSVFSDPYHCYASTGTYIVTLTIADNLGYTDTVQHTLTITHLDTTGCNCDSLISVNDPDDLKLTVTVSPNPVSFQATFRWKQPIRFPELKIYNVLGILVRKESMSDGSQHTFYREALVSGIYFYEITDGSEKQKAAGKLLLEKLTGISR